MAKARKAPAAVRGPKGRGRPKKPSLKWTVHLAAVEFAIGDEAVKKRLAEHSSRPGPDGFFSTLQIATALYGGLAREKLLRIRAQRQLAELQLQQKSGELLQAGAVAKAWESIIIEVKSRLYKMANTLPGKLAVCRNEKEIESKIHEALDETLLALTDARIETDPDPIDVDAEVAPEVEPVAETEEES